MVKCLNAGFVSRIVKGQRARDFSGSEDCFPDASQGRGGSCTDSLYCGKKKTDS